MIMLDTHVFVWWIHKNKNLPVRHQNFIEENISGGLGVSIISFWEISKLVEKGRLHLPRELSEWIKNSLQYDGIKLLDLNIEIILKVNQISKEIHKDPADQLIIATSVVHNIPIVTLDKKILAYSNVQAIRLLI